MTYQLTEKENDQLMRIKLMLESADTVDYVICVGEYDEREARSNAMTDMDWLYDMVVMLTEGPAATPLPRLAALTTPEPDAGADTISWAMGCDHEWTDIERNTDYSLFVCVNCGTERSVDHKAGKQTLTFPDNAPSPFDAARSRTLTLAEIAARKAADAAPVSKFHTGDAVVIISTDEVGFVELDRLDEDAARPTYLVQTGNSNYIPGWMAGKWIPETDLKLQVAK